MRDGGVRAGALASDAPARNESGAVACDHCGQPVPATLFEAEAARQFCCTGCRTVHALLHDHGLEGYYALAERSESERQPARTTGRDYRELDDPVLHGAHVKPQRGGLLSVELYLEGVHCAACVWVVEKVPLAVPGCAEARLDLGRGVAHVTWDPARTPLSAIARFLDNIGYPPHLFRGAELAALRRREDRALLIRIGVAGAVAGNVMLLAFALYAGLFDGMTAGDWTWFRWLSLGVTLPTLIFAGDVFFKGALLALRTRRLSLDVPIALGLTAGFIGGAINTARGSGEIYFDSIATLTFLLLVGRLVQRRGLRRAADAAERLLSLVPAHARRAEADGSLVSVPVEALRVGDVVEVHAGESIPADGVVSEGASELNRAWLTGEPEPHPVRVGDFVEASAVNLVAPMRVRVARTGEETRVGKLMSAVQESLRRRAPVVALADRISGYFVLTVLTLAAVTFAVWLSIDAERAIENATALLIVTCPCALGLATPLAMAAAVGRAASAGILVKGGDALERLARAGRVWLDKTGTLTQGRITLTGWYGDTSVQPLVRALETKVRHPIAEALVSGLPAVGPAPVVEEPEHVLGGGVRGVVDGQLVGVGSPRFIEAQSGATLSAAQHAKVAEIAARGGTPIVVAHQGQAVAVVSLGDTLRPEARETVQALRGLGFEVGILSGDHPGAVHAAAQALGIGAADARGGATPEHKADVVREGVRAGSVIMVGDGVNDAAALSAATVGVAVHGGAEAGIAAADIFLTTPGLRAITALVRGARRTLSVVRRNLLISLSYNVLGVTLAMTGVLDPLIAAIMMPASSLSVVISSYRARTFRADESGPHPKERT